MNIITHRGLNASKDNYFVESSLEAFTDQLNKGFGLEFDIQITRDNGVVVIHDSDLKRISDGKDNRKISNISIDEILKMNFNGCHLTSFDQLLYLINKKQTDGAISAIHLKSSIQNKKQIDIILPYFRKINTDKFIIFDVKIETAKYLKEKNKKLHLAPSVAHPHDIKRYNNFVGGTLMQIETALKNMDLFDWVWLDEWDKINKNGNIKKFYTKELFKKIRAKGLKIGLITPELHSSSPSLLGSEKHQDADDKKILFDRIREIIKLKPDIICTDYPNEIREMTKKI